MQYGSSGVSAYAQQICWLPMACISPRATCTLGQENEQTLAGLAESIRMSGLLKPITVERIENGRYVVVSGNRRLLACRMLGMTHIDAMILWSDEETGSAQQLLEGILSGRMHYLTQARALHTLNTVYGLTREELGRTLGQSPLVISERIRLTAFEPELQALLIEERIPERMAQTLLRLPDHAARMRIVRQMIQQQLTPREVEALVSSAASRLPAPPLPGGRTITRIRDHRLYLNALHDIIAQMQEAGVETSVTEEQKADRIEITLAMSTRKRRCQS